MSKSWVKNYFAHGRCSEVGQKQKTEEKKEERNGQATHGARKHAWRTQAAWAKNRKKEREKERLNNGDNNGQATHGTRKHAWRTQAAWAKNE